MAKVEVDIDDAYKTMVETLQDELGAEVTEQQVKQLVQNGIREMYDNREQLKRQLQES